MLQWTESKTMLSDVLHYFKDLQTINTSCCFLFLVQIGNFSGLPPSFSIDWQRGNQSAGRTDGAQVHFYPQANFGSIGTKSSIYLPIHKLKTVNIFTSLHLYSSTGFHLKIHTPDLQSMINNELQYLTKVQPLQVKIFYTLINGSFSLTIIS